MNSVVDIFTAPLCAVQVLRIKPPMCLTESDVHFAIAVMRKVLNDFSKDKYNN